MPSDQSEREGWKTRRGPRIQEGRQKREEEREEEEEEEERRSGLANCCHVSPVAQDFSRGSLFLGLISQ